MGSLSPQIMDMPDTVKNAIMNPFARSLTEAEWKEIVRGKPYTMPHFLSSVGAGLAKKLGSNARHSEFEKIWEALPEARRKEVAAKFNREWGA
jgi:hypothetical protein